MIIDSRVWNIGLPKWPAMVIKGANVTPEQAQEILIRTARFPLSTNDRDFERAIYGVLGVHRYADVYSLEHYDALHSAVSSLGVLNLSYLRNDRIASCWIGGPKGWCNWDGTIGTSNYNIGKWPSVGEVADDWRAIAKAFPYLTLRCQLFCREVCEEGKVPLVEFTVDAGDVLVWKPESDLGMPRETYWQLGNERGCTVEQFREAVEYVRRRIANQGGDAVLADG